MSAPSMSLKDIALKLAGCDWFIFPLGVKSKEPDGTLAPHGFKSASNDPKQIESWWSVSPDANIGIDLGRSNLTVLDFDKGEPPAELNLPTTLTVKTARGTHVYFAGKSKQGDMHLNGAHIGEVKSDGGYTLAPYSVHPDGPVYTLAVTADVAPVPQGLLQKLTPVRESVDASSNGPEIPRGTRYRELVRIAGVLRNAAMSADQIYEHLLVILENRCPGYGKEYPKKLKQIANGIGTKPVGQDTNLILSGTQPQQAAPVVDTSKWRDQFRSVGQMDDGPIDEIIKGALQEGICFIGASPSDGKTLTSLAIAKAICTGEPLFGLPQYSVAKPRTVIYLIPESRDRAFRKRCEDFRIPDDGTKFLARTTSMGKSLELGDPYLMQALRETHAVVFLDTAVRFMRGSDENSAAQNRELVNDVIALTAAGAVCVVLVHHATKASQQEAMTLENMLRGTSDLAAMCDQAYGIRKDRTLYANGDGPMEIDLVSLKDREQIGALTTLRLAASRLSGPGSIFPTVSIIHETGNFKVVSKSETIQRDIDHLVALVQSDPNIPMKDLRQMSGLTDYQIELKLKKLGWHRVKGGKGGASPWHQDGPGACPYAKDEAKPESDKVVAPVPSRPHKPGTKEAIAMLSDFLDGTDESEYVEGPDVYQEASRLGISDNVLEKARKALGVVIGKDGGWSLPAPVNGDLEAIAVTS